MRKTVPTFRSRAIVTPESAGGHLLGLLHEEPVAQLQEPAFRQLVSREDRAYRPDLAIMECDGTELEIAVPQKRDFPAACFRGSQGL